MERTVGQRRHQPRRAHGLHERAYIRHQICNQQVAENSDAKRVPRAYRRGCVALDGFRHRGLNLHQYRTKFMATITASKSNKRTTLGPYSSAHALVGRLRALATLPPKGLVYLLAGVPAK